MWRRGRRTERRGWGGEGRKSPSILLCSCTWGWEEEKTKRIILLQHIFCQGRVRGSSKYGSKWKLVLSTFQTILQHWRDRVDIDEILENTGWREYWGIQGGGNTTDYRVEGILENIGLREYWRIQGGGNTGEYRMEWILKNTGWMEYCRIQCGGNTGEYMGGGNTEEFKVEEINIGEYRVYILG